MLFAAQEKKKRFTVSGLLTQTSDYCGGASPSQGLLDMLQTPQPSPGIKLAVRKGNTNNTRQSIVATAISDENGRFSFSLFPGTYCLVIGEKSAPLVIPENDANSSWDAACLKSKHNSCDYTFTVKGRSLSGIIVNYHKHCSFRQPCRRYTGPTPP